MQPRSYKLLKGAALLIFFLAVILFVTSQVVTVASRKVQVRDKEGQVIAMPGFRTITARISSYVRR